MKIDCHTHTSEISPCGFASAEEQIKTAIERGLDALIFTDHDIFFPMEKIEQYNEKYAPFKVFQGIELRLRESDGDAYEDILVLGIHDKILEEKKWSYPELHGFVMKNDGFLVLAHPYRYKDHIAPHIDVEKYKPHAIEVSSVNLEPAGIEKRIVLGKTLGSHIITNSDSHNIESTGSYYNILNKTPENEKELLEILKKGDYEVTLERKN